MNPFAPLLEAKGHVLLDGGLATALEHRGHALTSELWSARLLIDAPDEVTAVHDTYLRAGADCLTTATYQATVPGFARVGLERREAERTLRSSVEIAVSVRDRFLAEGNAIEMRGGERLPPIVAASVGPYGAYLADGSEYDGRYGLTDADLRDFHADRFRLLAGAGADLLACETIPSTQEAAVLLSILDGTPGAWAWLTFSCADGRRIWDGSPIETVVRLCHGRERVAGVGINCTDPRHAGELVRRVRSETDLPIVLYPNSGEQYDAVSKTWAPPRDDPDSMTWLEGVRAGWDVGARVVGGCCRIGPEDIAELRALLGCGDWST